MRIRCGCGCTVQTPYVPKVRFDGRELDVPAGSRLRPALLAAGMTPHNGQARWFNCKGIGSCGTCAVEVVGEAPPLTRMERWRLGFPPHAREAGLRLACQLEVIADLEVTKHDGFWGQRVRDDL